MHRNPYSPGRVQSGLAAVLAAGALALGACSAPAEDGAAADPLAGLDELDDATRTMVEFEATWQCDVTRFAFDDVAEMDAMLDDRLAAEQLTRDDLEDFRARLGVDEDLQRFVAELSDACGGAADGSDTEPAEF